MKKREATDDSHPVIRFMRRIGSHEFAVLAALAGMAALIAVFAKITGLVRGETAVEFDTAFLLGLRTPGDTGNPIGPPWLEEAARDLTALGSTSVLLLIVLGACCYLLLHRKWRTALFVALSIVGGTALSFFLKSGFDRPRPDLVAHQAEVFTSSFPSSHAMASAITFLTLGALLARSESSLPLKAYLLGAAALLTLIVGASRVYLGVHWPTDVLAGWAAGAAWAVAMWLLARQLQRRRQIDEEGSVDS